MKITDINLYHLSVPLKKPFKTALRTVESAEETIVEITTENGITGLGEAPPTAVITGDTNESIRGIIEQKIRPALLGEKVDNLERLIELINQAAVGNSSAKAAVDMAVYDLFGKLYDLPLFRLLGGYRNKVTSDLTISVNQPTEMSSDAREAVEVGYKTLKLKVGKTVKKDLARVKAIRETVGPEIAIRLDANQGWQAKEAVYAIKRMEEEELNVELVEQPVKANDYNGLKYVTDNVLTPVMADESLFSPRDCLKLLEMRACNLVNIKLMKAGGIYNALKINAIAESYGIECMLGSMLEAKVSVTAAAHLAAAKKNITRLDLDAPSLLAEDPVRGGIEISGPVIKLPEKPGLGIDRVDNLERL